jgi:RNA polymerase sigma-70 factor (TIGR02943 family)
MAGMNGLTDPAQWVDQYGDALFGYALARLRNRTLAEEAVQDTLVSALAARAGFQGRSSEKTWIFGILKNKITDHYRKFGREVRVDAEQNDPEGDYGSDGEWSQPPAGWSAVTPAALAENGEFMGVLDECLGKVPQKYAGVFTAREYDDRSTGEICKEFGLSASNLWVILHRVRHELRKCLDANWFGRSK